MTVLRTLAEVSKLPVVGTGVLFDLVDVLVELDECFGEFRHFDLVIEVRWFQGCKLQHRIEDTLAKTGLQASLFRRWRVKRHPI